MNCGLLGGKLSHSYSPQIHIHLGSYNYALFEVPPEQLDSFLKNQDFSGINVTIPYKKSVIPYCNRLSERAAQLGAVNTIVRSKDGTLIGHNTDYFGFSSMVHRSGMNPNGKKVLVLGSGGASVTAVAVLKELGANVIVVSRNGENNYANLDKHTDASIIVNATPVGMYPNNGHSPVDLDMFPQLEGVLDLIYNPARTKLLLDAEKRELITQNGLWMLIAQAKESAEWFTGQTIDDSCIQTIYNQLSAQMENIILVGMPGCGKSTIGKLLAAHLGKAFIDADFQIEMAANTSIPKIFESSGEDGFRKIETQVLSELGKLSGCIIATGGGCVTRDENYDLLHQNGKIIWIQRNIDHLPTDGRPLSQTGKLTQMYQVRQPLYRAFADYSIINDADVETAVNNILSLEGIS